MADSLLQDYAGAWTLTGQMLDCARNKDWDGLVEREKQRAALFGQIQGATGNGENPEQAELEPLIRNILAADVEIRELTVPWMNELQEILGSIGTEKKLHKAYETP